LRDSFVEVRLGRDLPAGARIGEVLWERRVKRRRIKIRCHAFILERWAIRTTVLHDL
jgi:hypothetical protein